MPLDRPKLSAEQIEAVRNWIENEAPYDKPLDDEVIESERLVVTNADRRFWSFLPLAQPRLPEVKTSDWCETPVDRFILAGFERNDVPPATRASREKLIRRAKLVLLGLPPTPEEIDAFVADARPDAWPRLIERMLSSPHYGERWARHWLDVVRFAESYGFEHDLDNDHAYHYRDFVIRALNDDMPFDQFVRWQIAGDELAAENSLAWMATGFLAAGVRNADIAKVRVEQERYDELDDIVSTIGTSMLGLSVGCSRCHDHKYDPISQDSYYRLVATFERTIRGEVELEISAGKPASKVLVASESITPLARIYNPPPAFYKKTWFLSRGDAKLKEYEVSPGWLEVLTRADLDQRQAEVVAREGKTYRRSRLARWITDTEHGAGALLARVIVNRVWQHHFGRGIVETPNDFGRRGARPTHPELLEWLAAELVNSQWNIKHLHRLILSSATWRQAALRERRSPGDEELFRGHKVRRLEAEAIRDAMLAASDSLDSRMYGPGTLAAEQPRRSIYFKVKRSQLVPMMTLFDAPDPLQSTGRRPETTVAPQALALMNAKHVRRLAERFAARISQAQQSPHVGEDQREASVRLAYRRALGRAPTDAELKQSIDFIRKQEAEYGASPEPIASPSALDAIVFRLDATALTQKPATRIQQWGNEVAFSAVSESFPLLDPQATAQGKPAVRFGPAPTILRATDPRLNFGTRDFTVTTLFRIAATAGDDNHILGKDSYSGAAPYSGYFLQHHSNRLKFCTRNIGQGKGYSTDLETEPFVRKGRWYRVTGVRRSGVLSLYIDDAEAPAASMSEAAQIDVSNDAGFKIGDMDESPSSAFNGSIAELIVFNRGLTSDEVRDTHEYLRQKYLDAGEVTPVEMALADFCQALLCLNEFIYIE